MSIKYKFYEFSKNDRIVEFKVMFNDVYKIELRGKINPGNTVVLQNEEIKIKARQFFESDENFRTFIYNCKKAVEEYYFHK